MFNIVMRIDNNLISKTIFLRSLQILCNKLTKLYILSVLPNWLLQRSKKQYIPSDQTSVTDGLTHLYLYNPFIKFLYEKMKSKC